MESNVENLKRQLQEAEEQEAIRNQQERDSRINAQKAKRQSLLDEAATMNAFARKEAAEGNIQEAKTYQDLAKKAEIEASNIEIEGEAKKAEYEPTQEELLTEYRQESTKSNNWWFTGIALLFSFLYLRFGVWIKEEYPDAGIHDWATVHKLFSVIVYLFIIEIALFAMSAIRDNYLYRYGDAKRYISLDVIKDFYETNPQNRLWLRFAYFGLRFLGAVLLASGNLV